MGDKLKPCPFCGHNASLYDGIYGWTVICDYCEARTGDYDDGYYTKGKDRAVASWNSRKKTPAKTWVGDEN